MQRSSFTFEMKRLFVVSIYYEKLKSNLNFFKSNRGVLVAHLVSLLAPWNGPETFTGAVAVNSNHHHNEIFSRETPLK